MFTIKLIVAICSLALAIICGIMLGTEKLTFAQVFSALFKQKEKMNFVDVIVCNIRLPRVFLAGLCGALLAGSGAVFQGCFRNSLADSGVMGISSGAAFGAVVSGLLPKIATLPTFFSANITTFCAFAGSTVTVLLIYAVSKIPSQQGNSTTILLTGTAASTFFASLTSFIILAKENELYKMFVWTLGSFNGKGWDDLVLLLPVAIFSILLMVFVSSFLDLISGGRLLGESLGLNVKKMQWLALGSASLAAAAAVCIGGTIGFVGLIIPHLVRRIYSPRYLLLLPVSFLWGAIFLIVADTLARTVMSPSELPVGIVTALVGSPFFVSILFTTRNMSRE